MFLQNRYSLIYWKLIERARDRILEGYFERHHVVPRSLGGDDEQENIVTLTAREHFICHCLLVRMTEGRDRQKMSLALWTMARTRRKRIRITSRVFARLRTESASILKEMHKGKPRGSFSDEHRSKISSALTKFYSDPANRDAVRKRSTGKRHSQETRAKMSRDRQGQGKGMPSSKGMLGKKHSEETRAKMREAWKRRKANPNDGTMKMLREKGRITSS